MTTIAIPLYKGITHLDFTGPHQFLASVPGTTVIVASMGGAPIESHGLTFSNLADLEAIDECDILCVPGGSGCGPAMEDPQFLAAIRRLAGTADYLTSVCTGSLILGAAGMLAGRRAACHWAGAISWPRSGPSPKRGESSATGTSSPAAASLPASISR